MSLNKLKYNEKNMKIVVTFCMALLLLTGCKKSEEEMQLEEFLQTHYPATKVKIISISKLDSIYDPRNPFYDKEIAKKEALNTKVSHPQKVPIK